MDPLVIFTLGLGQTERRYAFWLCCLSKSAAASSSGNVYESMTLDRIVRCARFDSRDALVV